MCALWENMVEAGGEVRNRCRTKAGRLEHLNQVDPAKPASPCHSPGAAGPALTGNPALRLPWEPAPGLGGRGLAIHAGTGQGARHLPHIRLLSPTRRIRHLENPTHTE